MPSKIQEEWRPVVGYEDRYEVSNLGRVRSITRDYDVVGTFGGHRTTHGRILKPIGAIGKYQNVNLGFNNKVRVHKIVAVAFVPNPDNKKCIDHIDGDKQNNAAWNLRWCTYKENNNNPKTKYKICRSVVQIDPTNGFVTRSWDSISDARRETGIKDISKCCRGLVKTAGGYKWKYADETSNS